MKAKSNQDIVMHFIKFVIWLVWLLILRDLTLSAAHIGGAVGSDDIRVQEEAKWVF